MVFSRSLSKLNEMTDYMPFVSTFVGLYKIFYEYVVLPLSAQEAVLSYHEYREEKDFCRSLLLLIPIVGNIAVGLLDLLQSIKKGSPSAEGSREGEPGATSLQLSPETEIALPLSEDSSLDSFESEDSGDIELGECVAEFSSFYPDEDELENALRCILQEGSSDTESDAQLDLQDALGSLPQITPAFPSASPEIESQIADMQLYRRVAMTILRRDGLFLQGEPPPLCDDFEFVLAAVTNNGLALQFASHRLRSHPEIIRVAMEQNPLAKQYAIADACQGIGK